MVAIRGSWSVREGRRSSGSSACARRLPNPVLRHPSFVAATNCSALGLLLDVDGTGRRVRIDEGAPVEHGEPNDAGTGAERISEQRDVAGITRQDRDGPPGLSTRSLSRATRNGSGTRYCAPKQQMASKVASANGNARASPRT